MTQEHPPDTLTTLRAREAAKASAEAFAKYVIDEAENTVTPTRFDVDAVNDAIACLSHWGYKIDDRADTDGKAGLGVAHPDTFAELQREWENRVQINRDDEHVDTPNQIGVHGVDVHADASLPEDTAIILHPDAAAPRPPTEATLAPTEPSEQFRIQSRRPWLVRDPKGVVVVEVDG